MVASVGNTTLTATVVTEYEEYISGATSLGVDTSFIVSNPHRERREAGGLYS